MAPQRGHRKRCVRWDTPWAVHYLTFSCQKRRAFFTKDRPRRWFLDSVQAARERHPFDLWAFVVMPEHAHLLVWPHEGVRISSILQGIKQPVSQRAVAWLRKNDPAGLKWLLHPQEDGRRTYRFWLHGGGYDRNMRSVRETHEKLKYTHENPVRRGLVDRAEDWPWSSARAWAEGVDEPIPIDRDTLPPLELSRPGEY